MVERRRLIVVSNRGPASFSRDEDGKRVARRGGGGLVTALRSLVAHHDVTWIASAMTRGGPRRRRRGRRRGGRGAGARRLAVPAAARRSRPGRLRLVLQRRREPDALVSPALPLGPRLRAGHRPRASTTPGTRATCRSTRASRTRCSPSSSAQPDAAVFFHDYHLYLAPRYVREARPDAPLAHFVHIPWPEPNNWRVLPEPIRDAPPRRAARKRRGRLPRATLAPELPPVVRATSLGADCDFERERRHTRAAGPSSRRSRSRSTPPSSRSSP